LRELGAKIEDVQRGFVYCKADNLKGCEIHLDYPSVGATENIMLASVFAKGQTQIHNCAKEPEISDLQRFLRKMGVDVTGAGSSTITVNGKVKKLSIAEHEVMPDRIVAGTYLAAAAITGGSLVLHNVIPEHMSSIIYNLREAGCRINVSRNRINIIGPKRASAIETIRTLPYPGFPTDMQPQMVALLSTARGTSIIVETVFENRFRHVDELLRMGAYIKLEGRTAIIKGVPKLIGAKVKALDLRGGASLVLAGLAAEGETEVSGVRHIDRGYQDIEKKLSSVGAIISRED